MTVHIHKSYSSVNMGGRVFTPSLQDIQAIEQGSRSWSVTADADTEKALLKAIKLSSSHPANVPLSAEETEQAARAQAETNLRTGQMLNDLTSRAMAQVTQNLATA